MPRRATLINMEPEKATKYFTIGKGEEIRQEIKITKLGKEVKLSLFVDNMIFYIENPKDSAKIKNKNLLMGISVNCRM